MTLSGLQWPSGHQGKQANVVSSTLHESFRTAYGFWRGVGPRGNALLSFAHELAKIPEVRDVDSDRKVSVPEANALVTAVLMLDEAWRRQYTASDVTDKILEELLSTALSQSPRYLAPARRPQVSLESRPFNRHAELERVCLAYPVSAFYEPGETGFATDREVPAGASGTIVAVLGDGQGYEVEFTNPFTAIATVQDADLS